MTKHRHTGLIRLQALLPKIVKAAQDVYDDWDQDDSGISESYDVGGICDTIADEIVAVLSEAGIEAMTFHYEIGENHTVVFCKLDDGIYNIDILPGVYEKGGGYLWRKRKGVIFDESDVVIDRVETDLSKWDEYLNS